MGVRHVQAVKQLGMLIVGIMDVVPEAAKAACNSEGLPEVAAFNDVHKMLAQTQPQAVVIATAAPSHCDLVIAAADELPPRPTSSGGYFSPACSMPEIED